VQAAAQLGAEGYIVKPVKRNELEARVRAALERTGRTDG